MSDLSVTVTYRDCPHWDNCNSALCPLDTNWNGTHRSGEPICRYALNSEKEGAAERYGDDVIFGTVVERLPAIRARYHDIDVAIAKAALSPMRMGNGNVRPKRGADGPEKPGPSERTPPGPLTTPADGSAGLTGPTAQ